MPLDLDPIRKRLAIAAEHDLTAKPATCDEYYGDYSQCGGYIFVDAFKEGTIPPLAVFVSNAPGDIAALLAEVERLRAENSRIPDNIVIDNKTAGEIQQLIIDLAAKVESLRTELEQERERVRELERLPLFHNRQKVERLAPVPGPDEPPVSFGWKVGWVADELERVRAENKALRAELEKTNGKVQKLKKALQRCHDEDDERRLQLR